MCSRQLVEAFQPTNVQNYRSIKRIVVQRLAVSTHLRPALLLSFGRVGLTIEGAPGSSNNFPFSESTSEWRVPSPVQLGNSCAASFLRSLRSIFPKSDAWQSIGKSRPPPHWCPQSFTKRKAGTYLSNGGGMSSVASRSSSRDNNLWHSVNNTRFSPTNMPRLHF